jgi:hypothetical protein
MLPTRGRGARASTAKLKYKRRAKNHFRVVSETQLQSVTPVKPPLFLACLYFPLICSCLLIQAVCSAAAAGDENWDPRFCLPGVDGQVYVTVASGSRLYVGGTFIAAGGNTNIAYVACWNGTNWSALGGGVNGPVRGLAVNGNDVYVGGDFWEARQTDGTVLTAYRIVK